MRAGAPRSSLLAPMRRVHAQPALSGGRFPSGRRGAPYAPPFHVEAFANAAAAAAHDGGWGAWQSFRARGVRPDQRVVIAVLRHCEERRAPERAAAVEAAARADGLRLDGPLYWALLRTYGAGGRGADVARLLAEMQARALLADHHALTAAASALLALRRAGAAWAYFTRMHGAAAPGLNFAALLVRALSQPPATDAPLPAPSAPPSAPPAAPAASALAEEEAAAAADAAAPTLSAVGRHLRASGFSEAEAAAVIVRGLDLAGAAADERRVLAAASPDVSELALCAALLRLHAAHNDVDGAQGVVQRLRERGRDVPPALWEMLFGLFRARNVLPKALHAADEYQRQTGHLTPHMALGLLELGVNYNAPDTVFAALRHVHAAALHLPEPLLRATMRLLYRFGKREPARQLVARVRSAYPPAVWRNLEAFLAAENMADLLPRA